MTSEALRLKLKAARNDFHEGRIDATTFNARLLEIRLLHEADLQEEREREFTKLSHDTTGTILDSG